MLMSITGATTYVQPFQRGVGSEGRLFLAGLFATMVGSETLRGEPYGQFQPPTTGQ